MTTSRYIEPPYRLLLGPGPSMIHPRVRSALSSPSIGLLDPYLLDLYAEVQGLLRRLFQTENEWTFAISGTGTSGMEAVLTNLIEPGDSVLCAVKGYFGERLADISERCGAEVDRIERPWGEIFSINEISQAFKKKSYKLLTLVHAETSTGALQLDIGEIAAAAHQHGTLLVLDVVTSLGGMEIKLDAWDVDAAYSASQKCISAPPGLAPITINARARDVIQKRRAPVQSFYLELQHYANYWNGIHAYHHTASSNLHYAFREALGIIFEESLESRFQTHQRHSDALSRGLSEIGIPPIIPEEYRIPVLTTVHPPAGCDEAEIRKRLLNEYGIEIAGGFGKWKGEVWRIGLMGESSKEEHVSLLLEALGDLT